MSIVNGLGPGDLAAVGHTMYGVPQNFTTDKARLKKAIDTTAFGRLQIPPVQGRDLNGNPLSVRGGPADKRTRGLK